MLIEVRGTNLYVDQRGAADTPPLLFLHGGPGSGSYDFLSFQGDRLAQQLRLIGVDQRGVQQSDPLTGPVNEVDLIADFEALRETLGLERWAILGHSFGGRLALRYAVMHPAAVTKVIFENPAWDLLLNTETLIRAAQRIAPAVQLPPHDGPATTQTLNERFALLHQLGDRRMEIYFAPDTQDVALPADTEIPDELHARSGRFSEEIMKTPEFLESLLPLLAQITQPALLIKGEHDPATSPTEIAGFQADVPEGTYYFASGAGHFVHAEAAEAYTRLVTGFVLS
ncbi:alpha/beta hydrolase [Kribbella antibiotica]|uniref:Alpha/beta hydrolase n=1 Tax=Kribbella antibiotica TaxID=190195 RepID=A0A4R4YN15_9ACTN|nr:alpha/beta hydrolase [Kribbella antibiotica]TDD46393.1 alpha/beta hydrolase [Kribbella antibiotica]